MTTIQGLGNSSTGVLSSRGGKFGDNPFLQLLTEQLRNQTPLEPVDNASFMQQMAQYSSMQEQRDLNKNMLSLLDYQGLLARLQGLSEGSNLLGKQVTYDGPNGTGSTGTVASVYIAEDGEVRLKLESGEEIGARQITGIAMPSGTNPTPTTPAS